MRQQQQQRRSNNSNDAATTATTQQQHSNALSKVASTDCEQTRLRWSKRTRILRRLNTLTLSLALRRHRNAGRNRRASSADQRSRPNRVAAMSVNARLDTQTDKRRRRNWRTAERNADVERRVDAAQRCLDFVGRTRVWFAAMLSVDFRVDEHKRRARVLGTRVPDKAEREHVGRRQQRLRRQNLSARARKHKAKPNN